MKQCNAKLTPLPSATACFFVVLFAVPSYAGAITTARKMELLNLVRQDCGSCHGMTMKGGLGTPLLPQALNDLTVPHIAERILDGVPGTPMPPWRGLLTTDEAMWIAGTLKRGMKK